MCSPPSAAPPTATRRPDPTDSCPARCTRSADLGKPDKANRSPDCPRRFGRLVGALERQSRSVRVAGSNRCLLTPPNCFGLMALDGGEFEHAEHVVLAREE